MSGSTSIPFCNMEMGCHLIIPLVILDLQYVVRTFPNSMRLLVKLQLDRFGLNNLCDIYNRDIQSSACIIVTNAVENAFLKVKYATSCNVLFQICILFQCCDGIFSSGGTIWWNRTKLITSPPHVAVGNHRLPLQ